jgi:hypothetical protein
VVKAFEMRANGASIERVWRYLRQQGIGLSFGAIERLLRSRLVIGELHFGKLKNLDAHEAIIDRALWERVQRTRVSRGRKPKSDRVLARLGVLRCACCGARLSVSSSHGGTYPVYQHPRQYTCETMVTIGAVKVEQIVVEAVKDRLADVEGRASAEEGIRAAEQRLESAQADIDAAVRAFVGFEDELAVHERLVGLREARDAAQEEVDQIQIGGVDVVETVSVKDWDKLTRDERRDLIRATVERVEVAPGRGPDRVSVVLR